MVVTGHMICEHTNEKHPNFAIMEHTSSTGHHYTLDDTKILVREEKWFPWKIRDTIHIYKRSPALNQDGVNIRCNWWGKLWCSGGG